MCRYRGTESACKANTSASFDTRDSSTHQLQHMRSIIPRRSSSSSTNVTGPEIIISVGNILSLRRVKYNGLMPDFLMVFAEKQSPSATIADDGAAPLQPLQSKMYRETRMQHLNWQCLKFLEFGDVGSSRTVPRKKTNCKSGASSHHCTP